MELTENEIDGEKCGYENVNDDSLIDILKQHVPTSQILNFRHDTLDKDQGTKQKIATANEKAESRILTAYLRSEAQRLQQQKPLMLFLMIIFGAQLLVFNTLMFIFVLYCINKDPSSIAMIADFLKYYIGAVIIEIIGMIAVMVNNVFSTHHSKLVQSIFNKSKKD